MKIKVNDIVIPKSVVARVTDVTAEKVVFERTDSNGKIRTFEWTLEHAKTRGVSLVELVNDNLFVINPHDLKKLT